MRSARIFCSSSLHDKTTTLTQALRQAGGSAQKILRAGSGRLRDSFSGGFSMLPALPRFIAVAAAAVAASSLLLCSGCGKSAADAHSPPPQTLSEPIVPTETALRTEPAIPQPASPSDVAVLNRNASTPLPAFVEPAAGRAAAPAIAAAPAAAGPGSYHTLAKGETLYALSRKYNVKVAKIIAANQFKDPNRLAIGTRVYIPN